MLKKQKNEQNNIKMLLLNVEKIVLRHDILSCAYLINCVKIFRKLKNNKNKKTELKLHITTTAITKIWFVEQQNMF